MFDTFTEAARRVVGVARTVADEFGHEYIGPEHYLLAMVEWDNRAVAILRELEVLPDRIREETEEIVPESRIPRPRSTLVTKEQVREAMKRHERHKGDLKALARDAAKFAERLAKGEVKSTPFTPEAQAVLRTATEEAAALGQDYTGTEHLLLGILACDDEIAVRVLREEGVEVAKVRERVRGFSEPEMTSPPPDVGNGY